MTNWPSPILPSLREIGLRPFDRRGVYQTPESSPAPSSEYGHRNLPPIITNRPAPGSMAISPVTTRIENWSLHENLDGQANIRFSKSHVDASLPHYPTNEAVAWPSEHCRVPTSTASPSPASLTSSEDIPFSPTNGRKRLKAADDTHKRRERKRRAADTLAHKEAVPDLERAGWSIGTKLKAQNKFSAQGLDFKKEDVLNGLVVLVRCYYACMTRSISTVQEARSKIQERMKMLPEDSDEFEFLKMLDHSNAVVVTALQPAFPQEEVHAFTAELYARVESNLNEKEGDLDNQHSP